MLLGLVCYAYFVLVYSNHMFQGLSMILTLGGVVVLVLGVRSLEVLAFPVAYLVFAVTISEQVMNTITWRLQELAASGAYVLLSMLGVETTIRGNVLEVYDGSVWHPLNVAEACSGMRTVVAFLALSVAVAFLGSRHWWQRVALVLLGVPVALLMNVIRVAVLGGLSLWNPELAAGDAHGFIGTLLLFPAFLLFMGCAWAMNQVFVEPETAKKGVRKKGTGRAKGVRA
ncbi:MAG: exosortase/archaeosortase family protein [Phycisphaerales bacterium]|nr:exosortase/archaeosortase family protein [Phycisphaerales bacterium]